MANAFGSRPVALQCREAYVANLTETCDPENPLQLITKVQVAPNNVDDSQLLAEALPDLKKRTNLETVYADGGYGGPQSDPVLQEQDVALIQTAIRGQKRNPELLYLDDFAPAQEDEQDVPQQMTCPAGQTLRVALSASGKTYQADLPPEVCAGCEQRTRCPIQARKRLGVMRLSFTREEWQRAKRLRQSRQQRQEGRNLRAAVEATVRSVKHPFAGGKLPVRGRFRVTCLVIGSAAVTNVRRLHRHLQAKTRAERDRMGPKSDQNRLQEGIEGSVFSFFSALRRVPPGLSPLRQPDFGHYR